MGVAVEPWSLRMGYIPKYNFQKSQFQLLDYLNLFGGYQS